jgi:SAM-dependent methyltransferase
MATEVLEHCPEPNITLMEINRVLKPGGVFFFTVPFLWNLHEVPHDEFRYTPFAFERILKESGFIDIQIFASGGWHGALAQMLGLWVRRSPISPVKRKILSKLFKPLIRFLINRDVFKKNIFNEGQMITGLYGWAKK